MKISICVHTHAHTHMHAYINMYANVCRLVLAQQTRARIIVRRPARARPFLSIFCFCPCCAAIVAPNSVAAPLYGGQLTSPWGLFCLQLFSIDESHCSAHIWQQSKCTINIPICRQQQNVLAAFSAVAAAVLVIIAALLELPIYTNTLARAYSHTQTQNTCRSHAHISISLLCLSNTYLA